MANRSHIQILEAGAPEWNDWRRENPKVVPDLERADLRRLDLKRVNLKKAKLRAANLWYANLAGAKLQDADLRQAILNEADLTRAVLTRARLNNSKLFFVKLGHADLREAVLNHAVLSGVTLNGVNLTSARLYRANLSSSFLPNTVLAHADLRRVNLSDSRAVYADLSHTDLTGANLVRASMIDCNLEHAVLDECSVYGISAWNLKLSGAAQQGLLITPEGESSKVILDNLEVAQFLYLLLNNERIRDVIDTITSKVVLVLGRFTSDRKTVLDAVRQELRMRGYVPVLFDFAPPSRRSTLEAVGTLASLARFVIADLTDARSVLQELQDIVPHLPSLPVQPILVDSQAEPGMFDFFQRFPWVLETRRYKSQTELLANLDDWVIGPVERKAAEQSGSRSRTGA